MHLVFARPKDSRAVSGLTGFMCCAFVVCLGESASRVALVFCKDFSRFTLA